MNGIWEAITQHLRDQGQNLVCGGRQFKCSAPPDEDGISTAHLMATLAGDSDLIYGMDNHKPLAPTLPAFNPPAAPDAPLVNPEMTQDQRDALDAAYKEALAKYQVAYTAAEQAYRETLPVLQQAAWDTYLAAGAEHDAAVIIPEDQPQISPSNLICHCGQELAK